MLKHRKSPQRPHPVKFARRVSAETLDFHSKLGPLFLAVMADKGHTLTKLERVTFHIKDNGVMVEYVNDGRSGQRHVGFEEITTTHVQKLYQQLLDEESDRLAREHKAMRGGVALSEGPTNAVVEEAVASPPPAEPPPEPAEQPPVAPPTSEG